MLTDGHWLEFEICPLHWSGSGPSKYSMPKAEFHARAKVIFFQLAHLIYMYILFTMLGSPARVQGADSLCQTRLQTKLL